MGSETAMRKGIKILGKVLSWIIVAIVGLPVAAALLLNVGTVQNFAVRKATELLSRKLETTVSIDRIRLRGFSRLVAEGLYIEDYTGDTMLYAKKIGSGRQQKAPCYTRKSLSGTYFWTRQKSISILRETGNSTSRSSSPDWAATPPNRRAPRGWPSATCGFPTRASCSATKGPTPSPRESISEIWCSTDSTSGATDSISTGEPSRWISPPCRSATSAASRSATSPQTSSPWATA